MTKSKLNYTSALAQCSNCAKLLDTLNHKGVIKNRNDARFWGLSEKKILCGCLVKEREKCLPESVIYGTEYQKKGIESAKCKVLYYCQIPVGLSNWSNREENKKMYTLVAEIKEIVHTKKTPYEKKIDLLNWLKELPVGKLEPNEKQKLQRRFSNEAREQKNEEHRKKTAEEFDKMIENLLNVPAK